MLSSFVMSVIDLNFSRVRSQDRSRRCVTRRKATILNLRHRFSFKHQVIHFGLTTDHTTCKTLYLVNRPCLCLSSLLLEFTKWIRNKISKLIACTF